VIARMDDLPFMEHPTGDFETVVDAMADAISRLRGLPSSDAWITFHAQGCAGTPDTYSDYEIRVRGNEIDVDDPPLDIALLCESAGIPSTSIAPLNSHYRLIALSPPQVAELLDSIFRLHYHLTPHPDEGDHYAVGAEW
jgi:hypothetical protein